MMRSVRAALPLLAALSLCAAGSGCDEAERGEPDAPEVSEAPSYPPGPYGIAEGRTLPDLAFEGLSADGARATLRLANFLVPEEAAPRLLVVQVSGGLWCGTCGWTASHFDETLGADLLDRVDRFDLVVRNRDNGPASADLDPLAWRDAVGAEGVPIGVDASFTMGAALSGVAAPLPLVLLVDPKTMSLTRVLSNPDPNELRFQVARALAELAGESPPRKPQERLEDELFYANEWDMLTAMADVPDAPPPDLTNEVADSPTARELGEALFFDTSLSPSGTIACATCHDPGSALSDGLPRAIGVAEGPRRTPSIALASHARWQNWDGRADSLWAQALGPFENELEYGSSRVFVARRVLTAYTSAYLAAFPGAPLPSVVDWPAAGKPGDRAYDALPLAQQQAITGVFVNVGKAIAAYERTFRVAPTAFDAYVRGNRNALTEDEKYGLQLFVRKGCTQCHWGPRLTDDAFHNTHAEALGRARTFDGGRAEGVARWQASEFRADGAWSAQVTDEPRAASSDVALGQFKTPPLRGVADLAFLGHAGGAPALAAVTEAYGLGGAAGAETPALGEREPWLMTFGETAQWGLVPFLKTLTLGESSEP